MNTSAPAAAVIDVWPLTPLQNGILFHSLWEREVERDPSYLLQFGIELQGRISRAQLESAIGSVLETHENLRAGFFTGAESGPVQFIPERVVPEVQEIDGADARETAPGAAMAHPALAGIADQQWSLGFDPARPPLVRALLIRIADGRSVLLLTVHHLVLDGWSAPMLLEEILVRATGGAGEPVDATYLDYLDAVLPEDDPEAPDRAAGVIADALRGLDAGTLLVAEPVEGATAERRVHTVPRAGEVRRLARDLAATPAAVITALWGIVLGRVVDEDDVVFGLTVSGRGADVPGIERVIGLLGNTLPFRVRPAASRRIADVVREAHRHHAVLAEAETADLAAVQGKAGIGPLFDSLLVIENYPGDVASWSSADGSLEVRGTWARDSVHYPLSLLAQLDGDDLILELTVREDAPQTADQILAQLDSALQAILDAPDGVVAGIPFPAAADPALDGGAGSAPDLVAALDAVRAGRAQEIALVAGGSRLTTEQLHRQADDLAALLVRGTGAVGILAPRTALLVVGVLAALRAGRPFLALDPELPAARIAQLVDDAQVTELIVDPGSDALAAGLEFEGSGTHRALSGRQGAAAASHAPDAPAYIVFTSGTTGRPKGCVNTRRGLSTRLAWMADRYGIGADDVILQKTPTSFDVSVWELVLPLVTGARLVLAPVGAHGDPERLDALIAAEGVTTLHFVPSMLAAYLDLVPQPSWQAVRRIICSGEGLTTRLAAAAAAAADAAVHNLYGPAEAAIDVTAGDDAHGAQGPAAPIGGAVPGTALRVLDSALRPVGPGGTGELYLAGEQLALGYAGQPALTAGRFIADPAGGGGRLYRTGDRVTLTPHGLVHRGRLDDQVKIRGMRVEPEETRSALEAIPWVARAAVTVDPAAGPALVAGIVLAPGAGLAAEELRTILAESLPPAQRPAALRVLDAIPTTANGKLDAHALRRAVAAAGPSGVDGATSVDALDGRSDGEAGGSIAGDAGSQAASEDCAALERIAGEILGAGIGPDTDLFTAGLDSISAIRFVAAARRDGIGIGLSAVFDGRSPWRVAQAAQTLGPEAGGVAATRGRALVDDSVREAVSRIAPQVESVLPLGPLQEGLYVHAQLGGDAMDVYVVQHRLTLLSEVSIDALQRAGDALLRRHPSLRAGFTAAGLETPTAFIIPPVPMPLDELDLSAMAPDVQRTMLDQLTERQVVDGFDLQAPPLIRLVAARLGEAHWYVGIIHHHILTDGWSQTLMLEDLFELYDRALATASAVDDAGMEPAAGYDEYLEWVGRQDHQAGVEIWRDALSGLSEGTIVEPSAEGKPPVLSESVSTSLSAELTEQLAALARRAHVTVSTVLSYAWARVLRDLTGRDDVVFGTTVSGRPAEVEGVDRMVGLLMNTVPVRVRIRGEQSIVEQLRAHMAAQAATMPAHHIGLGRVQRAAGVPTLFDTLYVFRNLPVDEEEQSTTFSRHRIIEAEAHDGTHYTYAMTVNPGRRLEVALAYRPDVVHETRAQQCVERFAATLEALVGAGDEPVARLTVDVPAQRPAIDRVNAEATRVPAEERHDAGGTRTVADLLVDAAARTPDRAALVGRDLQGRRCTVSFAELVAKVDALAVQVQARTAGEESVVALALPRAVEHVIAIFAVLRAGRTYLPLELSHPVDRRRRLAESAGAELVLVAPDGEGIDGIARLELRDFDAAPGFEAPRMRPGQLAYAIFTSGTSGEPKAVAVPHRGLVTMYDNHLTAIFRPAIDQAGRSPLRVAHTVSFSFDMSWEELFWLLDGHGIHIIDEDSRLDPPSLVEHYHEVGIDVVNVTPSYARELIRAGLLEKRPPALVLLGGEAVPAELWTRLREHDGLLAYDLYGPTEFTINALGVDLSSSPDPCLGRPILDARAYVLDTFLQEVPPGGTGELYLAGDGLTRGYLGQPGLTAARFVADPYGAPGDRLYRTGDLVHRRVDGGIEYRGRGDDQVKVRGHRIELAEIEATAESGGEVVQAAATVRRTPSGAEALCLHVVPAPGAGDEEALLERVRAALVQSLPAYSVPAFIRTIPVIPLTTNGKIDRTALPDPAPLGTQEEPSGRLEHTIAGVLCEVLGIERIGRDDSFFDLGGHSLLAMRAVARVADATGIPTSVGTVMANPTVRSLAQALAAPARGAGLAPMLTLRDGDEEHRPVFCIHPAGGFAWQFAPLVRFLPDGIGVIGMQAEVLSGPASTAPDIDALAHEYLARIREQQASGPYRLVGYSFGGNVAHAVAALLSAAGEGVEVLMLLDPAPLDPVRHPREDDGDQAQLVAEQSEFLAELAGEDELDASRQDAIRASKGVLGLDGSETLDAIVAAHAWSSRLMSVSVSPVTAVPTILVAAGQEEASADAWDGLLGDDVERHELDVDHMGMVSPQAWEQLGPLLAEHLGARP